ncbi:cytochrome c biogenesis CcdA family protein [Candidatus Latescibacterota bacterium]
MLLVSVVLCGTFFGVSYAEDMVNAQDKPEMLFFHSEDCEECKNVKAEFLPEFLKKYGSLFKFTELEVNTDTAIMDSLFNMEDRLKVPEEDKSYPAVYFMGTMIEGEIKVMLELESIVEAYIANPDSMLAIHNEVMARVPSLMGESDIKVLKKVHLAYFFEPGCKKCSRALEIIQWLEKTYKNIEISKFDIDVRENKILATAMGIQSGVPEDSLMTTPSFFVGEDFVLSGKISQQNLSNLLKKYAKSGARPSWEFFSDEELAFAESMIMDIFKSLSFFVVAGAGLGDGINPCAFATIIFFISYLTMIKRKGREILLVGFAFAFAVFTTYFLVGLGFFEILGKMVNIAALAKIIYGVTALVCIVFGFLSIGDYFKVRAGKVEDMSLQLPKFLKKRIHATIREKAKMKSFVIGALIAGFLVSIFELACTGQVYLPTIIFMIENSDSRFIAMRYLLVYNFFFIVPLLVVFGIVFMGVSSNTIAKYMEARVGLVKIVLAFVFFGVAVLLVWSVFI